jgi:hypothetical protein
MARDRSAPENDLSPRPNGQKDKTGVTRRDRLRRVVLLCVHFTRNLAYHRAGFGRIREASPEFCITIFGNFIDMAVMEWCKLFGDRKGKHSWVKVLTDPSRFEAELLSHLGINCSELEGYVDEIRKYRDQWVAHLDDLHRTDIPSLERARVAINFYHHYIVLHEATAPDLEGLPNDLAEYYDRCFAEATSIYGRCVLDAN